MAAPTVTLNGTELTIEITKGNKQWVAEITGTDQQYDLDRTFVSPYGQGTETVTVANGDIIERVYYSHSGNEKGRTYWIVYEGELVEIEESDVEDALDNPTAYYPEPELHECGECGDEFESAHGLSIHEGMIHDDSDDTTGEEPSPDAGETSAAVADGGEDYDAPTTDDYPMEQKEVVEEYRDDGDLYAGIEYHSLEDGFNPGVPHYVVSVGDVSTVNIYIGVSRPGFDENWDGGSWEGYLARYPYEDVGMKVGELLLWEQPHDDEQSHVRNRYVLDGDRVVGADMTVKAFAYRLLKKMIDESEHSLPDDDDGDGKPMTDGGAVADGSDETDWDLVAGDEPSRNGTRRIVSSDEARTPYTDSSTHYDELLGVEMEIGGQYGGDTIQYVNIQPQVPTRGRRATGPKWLCRLAVEEGDYDDLYADGDADDPLPGYEPETTGDYREADPEDPRGDGVYARDDADSPLTAEIADVVTREGGRIPVDFSAAVQNEGYARSRDWTVYAPAYNPYHVAAAVTDLLRDTDGVLEVRVHVSEKPASRIAGRLRATGVGYVFDRESEEDRIERSLRELRWESGLSAGQQRILQVVPSEERERVQEADFDDRFTDYESQLQTLHRHPGDAWDYHEVHIHINEEATDE